MQPFNAMRAYRQLLRRYGPQGWWPVYKSKKLEVKSNTQCHPEKSATAESTRNNNCLLFCGMKWVRRCRVHETAEPLDLTRHPCPQRLTEETRFQVCVGAILTQNTAWTNVERTFECLLHRQNSVPPTIALFHDREKGRWSVQWRCVIWRPEYIATLPFTHLARLIRPAGYFNQKAKKLHIFSRWLLREHNGSLARFFRLPTTDCRQQLLSLWGIGPETADSMLLYAGRHPTFVIDTYTKRFLAQHGITFRTYDEYQRFFTDRLPLDAALFNEYHALIVAWGKEQ